MICPICKEEIKLQKLNSHFKITLGNLSIDDFVNMSCIG
ncbi:unnamed protein product, partial [marine sediment metagenome]